MRKNWETQIRGNNVTLVPYTEKHVKKYHEWMKNENLQHLTGSEPLSLQEEYDMQKTWRDDSDKVFFSKTALLALSRAILSEIISVNFCQLNCTDLFLVHLYCTVK